MSLYFCNACPYTIPGCSQRFTVCAVAAIGATFLSTVTVVLLNAFSFAFEHAGTDSGGSARQLHITVC
ncbi:MAG TPA: hypothetical protein PKG63_09285 [Bacteroidales bacterium]|nr:hypothetical protein [Bacteroidales bacterium]